MPELRRLIAGLGAGPPRPDLVLAWSFWRRAHQAVAQAFHWGSRLAVAKPQL